MQTLSKFLGYGIVWGAFTVKLPQIIKIMRNHSTLGISFRSVVLEVHVSATQCFMNCLLIGYNIFRGNPFSIYGENVFLGVQNLIIIALFFIYPSQKSLTSYLVGVVLLVALSVPLIGQMVPEWIQEMSISLSIVICTQ